MQLEDTIILAAKTPRSNAYAQALSREGIKVKATILFSEGITDKPGQSNYVPDIDWPESPVFLPDFSIPLKKSLSLVCDQVISVVAAHVNDRLVKNAISEIGPKLIIYSGYGSQIVDDEILSQKIPILHLHSGWLPDFRGSTTTYFHLLINGACGVSAILLAKEIDAGPIIARKKYPKPPFNIDIDYLYDSAIRADLLVNIIRHYGRMKALPQETIQCSVEGNTYYIIHPVLKHIAMLSLM